jgi:nitroimidazol reductase NimA-like FMN-containing flavoprotein (pyridoxamine 5'-phosphate oxidase superfamily)
MPTRQLDEGGLHVVTEEGVRGGRAPVAERPNFPGYGIEQQPDGMLTWEWVSEQMAASRNYWICTTRPDGRPHAAPVWGIWLDETLYFGSGPDSVKARNLRGNPAVVVHLESGDDCVIFEGVIEPVVNPDRAWFERFADAYEAKYGGFRPEYPDTEGTYRLRPHIAFAWIEKDYPKTATRWRFDYE